MTKASDAERKKNIKISIKFPTTIIFAAALAALSIGYIGYQQTADTIKQNVDSRMNIILENQKLRLKSYLAEIENDLRQNAKNQTIREALLAFNTAWSELGKNQENTLQKAYINDNPNKLGEKEKLDFATAENSYNAAHKKYHPSIRNFLQERGYYDIFLFNLNGDLIYTVFKELDYATNLASGKYAKTGLGTVFNAALKLNQGQVTFDDFKPYSPSNGAAASFIAEPIFDEAGKRIGVLAFQMPINNLNNIMKSRGNLGITGETFIVGQDALMRSDSEINKDFKILETKIDAPLLAISSEKGINISQNEFYNNQDVIMAVTDLNFHGSIWTLVGVQGLAEVYAPLSTARNFMMLAVLAILGAVGIVGLLISRSITKPISTLTNVMSAISNGALETNVKGSRRSDEIGDMARAVLVFKRNALENIKLEGQQKNNEQQMKIRSEQERKEFASSFQKNIVGFISNVSDSCGEMNQSANGLIEDSVQSTEQSSIAKTAAERASMNVQTVAAAAEELSSSIIEISRQVHQSRDIVAEAMQGANTTNNKVGQLSTAATNIGDVISLIQTIAEQTNLLALNATIEAARAGDAGKGFAVVATEVKALANQTAKATEEISSHISGIQTSTDETVLAIGEITKTMNKVNDITTAISAAVEEQGSATNLISENIQEASNETMLVSENMATVTSRAEKANQSASEMSNATDLLFSQTNELNTQVDEFINKILTA